MKFVLLSILVALVLIVAATWYGTTRVDRILREEVDVGYDPCTTPCVQCMHRVWEHPAWYDDPKSPFGLSYCRMFVHSAPWQLRVANFLLSRVNRALSAVIRKLSG